MVSQKTLIIPFQVATIPELPEAYNEWVLRVLEDPLVRRAMSVMTSKAMSMGTRREAIITIPLERRVDDVKEGTIVDVGGVKIESVRK